MYSNLKILETIITEAFFSLGLLSLWEVILNGKANDEIMLR